MMAVHWGGEPCDLTEIRQIAQKHHLFVIEDAAHAIGASYQGKPIGSLSDFTCFSFQAIKQITSGDGGMLSLLDAKHAERAKLLRWFGLDRSCKGDIYEKHHVTELGYKYHMNDIMATMVSIQLEDLAKVNERRRDIANRYRTEFAKVPGLRLLKRKMDRESAHWLFTILVKDRESFMKKLASEEIETSLVHIRCDVIPLFGGIHQALPIMDHLEKEYVNIPLHNHLTDEEVDHVIRVIQRGW